VTEKSRVKPGPASGKDAGGGGVTGDTKPSAAVVEGKHSPELELAEVRTLTKMGKSKGNLTDEEIQGALSDIDLTDEQYERVYSHFRESGIDVVDEPEASEVALEVVAGRTDSTDLPLSLIHISEPTRPY
jgi:hypothetical protein